ncbi:uncharacterized protein LOC101859601 isoform X2 [Aplysia californica]|uniref:Uncharacterized protein LOC101859601 isoform X2 n=1 Tax=Aplysia californica TaxID=6500 RepID=A0ABM1W248_APLCA|nr:uncharacterized protein LOC101859601 isoform X2 [Aplysia californica]
MWVPTMSSASYMLMVVLLFTQVQTSKASVAWTTLSPNKCSSAGYTGLAWTLQTENGKQVAECSVHNSRSDCTYCNVYGEFLSLISVKTINWQTTLTWKGEWTLEMHHPDQSAFYQQSNDGVPIVVAAAAASGALVLGVVITVLVCCCLVRKDCFINKSAKPRKPEKKGRTREELYTTVHYVDNGGHDSLTIERNKRVATSSVATQTNDNGTCHEYVWLASQGAPREEKKEEDPHLGVDVDQKSPRDGHTSVPIVPNKRVTFTPDATQTTDDGSCYLKMSLTSQESKEEEKGRSEEDPYLGVDVDQKSPRDGHTSVPIVPNKRVTFTPEATQTTDDGSCYLNVSLTSQESREEEKDDEEDSYLGVDVDQKSSRDGHTSVPIVPNKRVTFTPGATQTTDDGSCYLNVSLTSQESGEEEKGEGLRIVWCLPVYLFPCLPT